MYLPRLFSPCWDGPIAHRTSDYYLNCTRYNDLLSSLIQSRKEFTFWKTLYGSFDNYNIMINKVLGKNSIPWHWDGFDSSFMQILVYGGELPNGIFRVAKVDKCTTSSNTQIPHYYPEEYFDRISKEAVFEEVYEIEPKPNEVIILNNMNPLFVHHGLDYFQKDTSRYVLMCGCGFSYNFINNALIHGAEVFD